MYIILLEKKKKKSFLDVLAVIGPNNVRLFSYNSLRSATDDFHPSTKIGGGGFGVVYKVSGVFRIYYAAINLGIAYY